ncbi:MAG: EscR/YscR/HrcR family type III secretion system export apparatus protein [Bdellovibrionales bacterium]|nr:EscR/YscR/HrcR family type III secretion system export apparatus protein [Bdellovibrionales bacterium]
MGAHIEAKSLAARGLSQLIHGHVAVSSHFWRKLTDRAVKFPTAKMAAISYHSSTMEALAPYITAFLVILLLTSFVKIFTTLTIFRYGLGLEAGGFGIVILGVSLGLSLLVMQPQIEEAGGLEVFWRGYQQIDQQKIETSFRPFLERNSEQVIVDKFLKILTAKDSRAETAPQIATPFNVLIAAFLVSELKVAFNIGFLILIPFLVVDLLVGNALMSLGVTQMSHQVISLPLKILIFMVVDGWSLLSEKLISSYF